MIDNRWYVSVPTVLSPTKEVVVQRPVQRIATIAIAATVAGLGLGLSPIPASAETYEELQQRVEDSTAAYDEALANVSQIQGEIDENEAKIAELEEQLPAQRDRAADSLRTLYKLQQSSNGIVDLILSADDFNEFITTITYLDRIQSKNMTELQQLADLNAELLEAEDTLSAKKAQADQELDAARQAQADALAAREEVRQQAIQQAYAEQGAAQEAIEAAAQDAKDGKTFTNASGQQTSVSTPESTKPAAETVAETQESQPQSEPQQQTAPIVSERDAFVNKWAPRIDAYLGGSPLGGHGRTFAEAAWDYNVDPRWSPAISCIESSKGAVCFRSHNAWGWGSASWGDWDTAIRSHVAGLAAGYGYTITPSAAQRYCPPTWQAWYSSVLAEMNCI